MAHSNRWIEARFARRGFDLILSHCSLPKQRLTSPPRWRFNQLSFCWLKQLRDLCVSPEANDPAVANDKTRVANVPRSTKPPRNTGARRANPQKTVDGVQWLRAHVCGANERCEDGYGAFRAFLKLKVIVY